MRVSAQDSTGASVAAPPRLHTPSGPYMILCAGNGTDGGHLGQREGQARRSRSGEEHAPNKGSRPTVEETKLEAGGHALPRREEGDGHAQDGERGKISLQLISRLRSRACPRFSCHTFSSCVAPMRLITPPSLVRDDLARLTRRALASMGDLVSKGVISKSSAMMAGSPRQSSASCVWLSSISLGNRSWYGS